MFSLRGTCHTDGQPQLTECPIYGPSATQKAFISPGIIEVHHSEKDTMKVIKTGVLPGKHGITQLEQVWDQEVNNFMKRHSSK